MSIQDRTWGFYKELIAPLADKGRRDLAIAIERKLAYHHMPQWKKKWRQRFYGPIADFDRKPLNGNLRKLSESVSQRGATDCIIFAGQVPDESLPDIYALSEVFVMPSREELGKCDVEGFGLVFLEANACAKRVVGGRSGGIPDAIVDDVTGLLVNPHNPDDIARTLAQLPANKDQAIRMGKQGRDRAVRDFNWARVVEGVQGILDSCLQDKPICGR